MKPSSLLPEFNTLLTDGPPAVRMVMLYEDGDAGRRARQFAHEVLHGDGGECAGSTSFWSFDLLGLPNVRAAAASAAASADLVILAASGESALPPEIEEWLGMWAWRIGERSPALVALLEDGDGRSASTIQSELRAVAVRKDLEFVAFQFHAGSQDGARQSDFRNGQKPSIILQPAEGRGAPAA